MMIEEIYGKYLACNGVVTDSRKVSEGCIFFALKGEHFNGNEFAAQALYQGAKYAIIDEKEYATDDNCILVGDVLTTLQQLANFHRRKLDVPVVAIAGSNGKTTTKELMAQVLATSYKTYFTKGNFNNQIGLPLTLLDVQSDAEIIILEMGARKSGDVLELCEIAEPTAGLITNIGKDHIEFFGTLENTLKTNAELFDYLKTKQAGVVFVNQSYPEITKAAEGINTIITFGETPSVTHPGKIDQLHPFLSFSYYSDEEWISCKTQLVGAYNFENAMCAVAVAKHFGISNRNIQKAIAAHQPKNNRSQLLQYDSNTLILDAYNANPSSMEAALDSFEQTQHDKKMVVLGDMLELGKDSEEEHLLIAIRLKKMNLQKIVLIGPAFGKVKDKLNCLHFSDYKQLKKWLEQTLPQNYLILVKASRGLSLEKAFVN